jgi:hypothetical protein
MDLVFLALDHGVGSVSDAAGEALIPFLLTQDASGQRGLKRFMADTLEESVGMARSEARGLHPTVQLAVLAYDGFVTIQGQRSDAVVVQAQRRGASRSEMYAQRYGRDGSKIAAVGNAVSLGEGESLF